VVRILLSSKAPIDSVDETGASALHIAAQWGHDNIVACLLDQRADLGLRDNIGRSVEDAASERGYFRSLTVIDLHRDAQEEADPAESQRCATPPEDDETQKTETVLEQVDKSLLLFPLLGERSTMRVMVHKARCLGREMVLCEARGATETLEEKEEETPVSLFFKVGMTLDSSEQEVSSSVNKDFQSSRFVDKVCIPKEERAQLGAYVDVVVERREASTSSPLHVMEVPKIRTSSSYM